MTNLPRCQECNAEMPNEPGHPHRPHGSQCARCAETYGTQPIPIGKIQEIQLHLWRVHIFESEPTNVTRWRRNRFPLAMALTAKEAIEMVEEKFPGCMVWSVNHVSGPRKSEHEDNPVLMRE